MQKEFVKVFCASAAAENGAVFHSLVSVAGAQCLLLLSALARDAEARARSTQAPLELRQLALADGEARPKRCMARYGKLATVGGRPHMLHIALPH